MLAFSPECMPATTGVVRNNHGTFMMFDVPGVLVEDGHVYQTTEHFPVVVTRTYAGGGLAREHVFQSASRTTCDNDHTIAWELLSTEKFCQRPIGVISTPG